MIAELKRKETQIHLNIITQTNPMTKLNWTQLSERERDFLVGQHIFGRMDNIIVEQQPEGTEGYRGSDLSGLWIVKNTKENFYIGPNYETKEAALEAYKSSPDYFPHYSTSIADAMSVLERFDNYRTAKGRTHKYEVRILVDADIGTWVTGEARTLEQAICLAALRAKGIEV